MGWRKGKKPQKASFSLRFFIFGRRLLWGIFSTACRQSTNKRFAVCLLKINQLYKTQNMCKCLPSHCFYFWVTFRHLLYSVLNMIWKTHDISREDAKWWLFAEVPSRVGLLRFRRALIFTQPNYRIFVLVLLSPLSNCICSKNHEWIHGLVWKTRWIELYKLIR